MFEEYLERCGDLGLGDGKPDELAPGARPDREAKMAQLREQMDLEKKLKELAQQLADCKVRRVCGICARVGNSHTTYLA